MCLVDSVYSLEDIQKFPSSVDPIQYVLSGKRKMKERGERNEQFVCLVLFLGETLCKDSLKNLLRDV